MKDQLNKKEKNLNTNVEFGIEFGDVNGAKLMEHAYANKKKEKNSKAQK
ncbi:hypothetical protein OEV98_00310 [Caldibacillus lycopersici]|uniref:YfhE family protein n=1 Tax=Perspicuibacillus lycopersici TaxID=1325689 RepID=A0AAE3LRQ8_9BACI|nr:hypothetical protein [Perspicuibacillus lycopersici]MCU9611998.1 hypothetical protein [Perspicuibacillus lycopersici]